jgi:hypothetical protein
MRDRETRQVRVSVVPDTKRETLQKEIFKNVKFGFARLHGLSRCV